MIHDSSDIADLRPWIFGCATRSAVPADAAQRSSTSCCPRFSMLERLCAHYVAEGQKMRPVILHRAIFDAAPLIGQCLGKIGCRRCFE